MNRFSDKEIQMTIEGQPLLFEVCYDYMAARYKDEPYPKYVYRVRFLGTDTVTLTRTETTLEPGMHYVLKGVNLAPGSQKNRNPAFRDYNELWDFRGDHLRKLIAVDDDGWYYVTTGNITSSDKWCMLLEEEMDCNLHTWMQQLRIESSIHTRLDLFYQLCCGLDELRTQSESVCRRKIEAHLDIKAENALLKQTATGWRLCLSDFATVLMEGLYSFQTTLSDTILSPSSTPPEVVDAGGLQSLTAAADHYALGILLIELFSSENPIPVWLRAKNGGALDANVERREVLKNAFLELSQLRTGNTPPSGSDWLFGPLETTDWHWDDDVPDAIRHLAELLVEYDPKQRLKGLPFSTLLGKLRFLLDSLAPENTASPADDEEDEDDFVDLSALDLFDNTERQPASCVYLINGSYSMRRYGNLDTMPPGPLYRTISRAMAQDKLDCGEDIQCYAVVYYADEGTDLTPPRPLADKASGEWLFTDDAQLRERLQQIEYRDGGLEEEDNLCAGINWINSNAAQIPNLQRIHIFTDHFSLQDTQFRLITAIRTLRRNYGDPPIYCHTPKEPKPGSGFDMIDRSDRPTVYYLPFRCREHFGETPPKDTGWQPQEETADPRDCMIQGSRICDVYEDSAFYRYVAQNSGTAYRTFVIDRRMTEANGSNSLAYLAHEDAADGEKVMIKELYPASLRLHRNSDTNHLEIDPDSDAMEIIRKVQEKFETEKTLLQNLQSSRIPTANCLIADGENRYLVMQYCASTLTLRAVCETMRTTLQKLAPERRQPSLAWTRALLQVLYIIADVTAQLHACGIAHNDLTADNILVSADFPDLEEAALRVYLIDFSEARRKDLYNDFDTACIRDVNSFATMAADCFRIPYAAIPEGWQHTGLYPRLLEEITAATMADWRNQLFGLLKDLHVDTEALQDRNRVTCFLPDLAEETDGNASDSATRRFNTFPPGDASTPHVSGNRFELVIGGKVIR